MSELRDYQKKAVSSAIMHFQSSKAPAVIVLPTGSGKSHVIAHLAKLAKGRVLILAHVKELIEQNFEKYLSFNLDAGIYSAGLGLKQIHNQVIFASIQSFANAQDEALENFSLILIDECHRIPPKGESQYAQLLGLLQDKNPKLSILGFTATPYRLDQGWIYNYHYKGIARAKECFFKKCIYELPLEYLIQKKYLTLPVKINSPVSGYDFSKLLKNPNGYYSPKEIEQIILKQQRLTPIIVENILEISKKYHRKGVMLFTSSIRHAEEVFNSLPPKESVIITGQTPMKLREEIIEAFKSKKLKYLVNVSVLTTGFDAPHVDLIAILRPTESISLYQQIVGRGLRLSPGKEDCLILDYTGQEYDLYNPEVGSQKPFSNAEVVTIPCPKCNYQNQFWGLKDDEGKVEEHFGRKCQGALENDEGKIQECGFLFRYKLCPNCENENDIAAKLCSTCKETLIDIDETLKKARSTQEAHVMKVDSMSFQVLNDKQNQENLEINYYDFDGNKLCEYYSFHDLKGQKAFYYNFVRLHEALPGSINLIRSTDEFENLCDQFKMPRYIVARKQKKSWKITEKYFQYHF